MVGRPGGGEAQVTARDRALAFGVLAAVVLAPAYHFARMEAARQQAAGEEWRALALCRTVLATGADAEALQKAQKAAGRDGVPGLSAACVQTSGGTDEFGIAAPARLLALGADGLPVELPKDAVTRITEAAGRARSARDEQRAGEACVDGGPETPLLCAAAGTGGTVAGVLATRASVDAGWAPPALAALLGSLLVLGLGWRRPGWQPRVVAGAAGLLAGAGGAAMMAAGAGSLLQASTAASATLAGLLGAAAGPLPAAAAGPGAGYVALVALATAALAAGLTGSVARVSADFRGRPFLYAAIAPAMLGMVLLIFVPFFMGVYLAFLDNSRNFVGLANFLEILFPTGTSDTNFWFTLGVTVLWTGLNVAMHVAIGLGLALVLSDAKLRGKAIYRVLLIVPWAVPNYITALVWKWIFNTQYGPANAILALVGIAPVDWLGRSFLTNFAANLATNTWLGFPFMMVISLGALQSIPADLYEAAEMDGAGRWQRFRHVTLPLLKPALVPAIVLGTIWTFNCFNVVYLVSGGAPDNQTNILLTEAYRTFRVLKNYGLAAAYSLIIFFILVAWTAVTNRVTKAAESVYE